MRRPVFRFQRSADKKSAIVKQRLKLESEDQLYGTIISLAGENGDEVLDLLRYVKLAFLSESKLDEFLDNIFPDLVAYVWDSLCDCLRCFRGSKAKVSLRKAERYHENRHHLTFTRENGAFKGIVRHLRDTCGGNPHEYGLISITASSTARNECHELVDYGWNNYWFSKNEPNSYIQFDFKSIRVCLTHYSLKSDGATGYHLLSWILEVSNDGSTWEAVDERNTQDLNGIYMVKTYECGKRSDSFVRFVRMRQTGNNSSGDNYFILSEIEFFGQLETTSTAC